MIFLNVFKSLPTEIPSIIPSANPLVIKKIITEGYTDEMKRINLFFYYQRIYRRTKNYRRKIHRRSISVGDFVGKLITDRICVLRWRKNSVGKTVKSCSVTAFSCKNNILLSH
jgi:hypothetical protein